MLLYFLFSSSLLFLETHNVQNIQSVTSKGNHVRAERFHHSLSLKPCDWLEQLRPWFFPVPSVPQVVDGGADLERGSQFDVHGGHEMLLPEQQQSLAINLL